MNFIVLDLEWNQCPSGKENEIPRLPFEIIEIGAVKLNDDHEFISEFREIVCPQAYTDLHYKTKEIVSLRAVDFKSARPFPLVVKDFFHWCGNDPAFCTWGPADLTEFQRNLAYHRVNSPFHFPLFYYDIQKIFSIVYEDRKSRRSLEYAVDFLHIKKEIPFHRALSDAVYTAKVMEHLSNENILENFSIDCYRTPQNRRQEIYLQYSTYMKYISKPFDSKIQLMKDRTTTSTSCYKCRKNIQKKIRWFAVGGRNYFCLAYCETHGYVKGKIRVRQREDGKFYAIKTLKLISPEDAYEIKEKKEILRLKRKLRKEFPQSKT